MLMVSESCSSSIQLQPGLRERELEVSVINGSLPGYSVHLFIRPTKLRGGGAAPFVYCGVPQFVDWRGEKPITVQWKLETPVPEHLRRLFKVGG